MDRYSSTPNGPRKGSISTSDVMDIPPPIPKRKIHDQYGPPSSFPPPRYEYAPAYSLPRPQSHYDVQISDANIQFDDTHESAPPEIQQANSHVDAAIIDNLVHAKQDKHTLYKIAVRCANRSWSVYRRYKDFVALNEKVRGEFACFQLHLPPRKLFRARFNQDFIDQRQKRLQEYLSNLLQLRAAEKCPAVASFFRLDNPPTADEDLDVSKAYCRQLNDTLSFQSGRMALTDEQLKNIIGELETVTDQNEELQKSLDDLRMTSEKNESLLTQRLKNCEERLASCQGCEKRLRQERDHVIETSRQEREAELQARKLCQEKRELAVRELLMEYEKTQSDIRRRVEQSMLPLLVVAGEVNENATNHNITENDSMDVTEVQNTLRQAEELMKCYHEHVVEGLQSEIQTLKSDLAKNEFHLKTAESDATSWKAESQKLDNRLKQTTKESKLDREEMLSELRTQKTARESVEERYFHHLILLMKMTMLSDEKISPQKINRIDAKAFFDQARQTQVPVEKWPVFILGQIRGHI